MSELQNNPEKNPELQPMHDNCDNCEEDYDMTADNTTIYTFSKQKDCDYLMTQCPHCEYVTRIFCQQETVELARSHSMLESQAVVAPAELYKAFLKLYEIELPKTYEITDRHEKLVEQFGQTLCAMTTAAPDLFWEQMSDESPGARPYQARWID